MASTQQTGTPETTPATSPAPAATPAPAPRRDNRLVVLLLVVIAILLAVIAGLLATRPAATRAASAAATGTTATDGAGDQASTDPTAQETAAPSATDSQVIALLDQEIHRDTQDAQAQGKVDAPVVLVLYSDFACPYCTLFAQEVGPQLAPLVKDGTLRIEWRDLAQITESSPLAAQAGIAAGKQGKFWEFHDALYAAADPSSHPEYTQDSLIAFAKQVGVADIDAFTADMTSSETATTVSQAKQHAYKLGISGTPFMIVNHAVIPGYKPADYVLATIQDQLAQASQG